jgi:hypothetical protein
MSKQKVVVRSERGVVGGALRIHAIRRAPVDARAEVQAASTSTTA